MKSRIVLETFYLVALKVANDSEYLFVVGRFRCKIFVRQIVLFERRLAVVVLFHLLVNIVLNFDLVTTKACINGFLSS